MLHSIGRLRKFLRSRIVVARRAVLALVVFGNIGAQPWETLAQGLVPTPSDSQHCPPISCSAQTSTLPEGCSCISDEVSVVCKKVTVVENGVEHEEERCKQVIHGGPPDLKAPEGCDPDSIKKQLGDLTGTVQFVTAPPNCQIPPDTCESLPNRVPVTLPDGSRVCQPLKCSKDCYRFGAHVDSKLPLVSRFSGVEVCATCLSLPLTPLASVDPNDKTGPTGVTNVRFVRGDSPLSYTIHFENLATATAPAQTVIVTDQLDLQRVDVDTFRLGPIAFANQAFMPAPGARGWTGSVDLSEQNLRVALSAGVDPTTGLVTWRFASLDPDTEQLTGDPNAGFLPPNINSPAGEGSVAFTVMPKAGLATGTEIRNQAAIVFDTNAPIPTPTWTNVVDHDAPVTRVLALDPFQTSLTFLVQWTGVDAGSSVGTFTVLVSDNGGPFAVWKDETSDTSAMFAGQAGHSYGFFSVGTDRAGNVEAIKTVAEASTSVGVVAACAQNVTSSVAIMRSGYSYNLVTRRFVQRVTLRNSTANAIKGPIALALDSLTTGVALYNPAGTTSCALPANDPFAAATVDLAPGATISFSLQFDNPSRVGIGYLPRVLAGTPR